MSHCRVSKNTIFSRCRCNKYVFRFRWPSQCCRCCGRKYLDRQRKWVSSFYLLVINSVLYMQNSFWHRSRSFSVTGWMWHVSAVKSRFLPKNEQAENKESLPNIRVKVSTLQILLTLHNCKIYSRMLVQQEQILHHVAWSTFYALFHDAFCWYYDYGVFVRHRIITWSCVTENAL